MQLRVIGNTALPGNRGLPVGTQGFIFLTIKTRILPTNKLKTTSDETAAL